MQQDKSHRIPWSILVSAVLMAFVLFLPMMSVPPMEHILQAELGLTHAQNGLLFSIPLIMIGAVAIPAGILSDRIGIRKAAGIGAIMIALGSILRSTATTPSGLIAFTVIYGIGLGWVWPSLPKLVSAWAPREKAGIFTGVYSAGIYAGAAVGIALTMPLVFPITNTFQGVFLIWGIPPIIAAALWWILVKEPPHNTADSELTIQGSTPFRELIHNRNLWLLSVFFLLYSFFLYAWVGWTPALLLLKGATPESAGFISSITMWVAIPAVFAVTRLAHKLGLRKPFLWIPAIVFAISAWAVINVSLPLSWLPMVIVAVAEASLLVTTLSLPIEMVPEKDVGAATGLMLAIGHAGALVGPWISGHLFDLTGNLNASFLLMVGVAVASVGIVFRLPETGPKARVKK